MTMGMLEGTAGRQAQVQANAKVEDREQGVGRFGLFGIFGRALWRGQRGAHRWWLVLVLVVGIFCYGPVLSAAGVGGRGGGVGGGAGRASFAARGGAGVARFGGGFGRNGATVSPRIANSLAGRLTTSDRQFNHRCRNRGMGNIYYSSPYNSYPYYPYYPFYDYPYLGGSGYQYMEVPLDYPDTPTSSYSGANSYPGEGVSSASSLRDVQSALAREGYYQGTADGVMGPMTREAIQNFQRDNHLTVTGKVTTAMLHRLGL